MAKRQKPNRKKAVKRKPRRIAKQQQQQQQQQQQIRKTYTAFCVDCGQEIPRPPFMVKANAVELAMNHTHATGHENTRIRETSSS